jgi:hypothetical protein
MSDRAIGSSKSFDMRHFRLAILMGSLAILAALLVGLGAGAFDLTLQVIVAVIASWIYTDRLQWIRLPKLLVYVLMNAGAILAIREYLTAGEQFQLVSVAKLLIYAQIPLLFQAKSSRTFEQIGVFVLLELVVACLLNDRLIFGLFLIPAIALSVTLLLHQSQLIAQERAIGMMVEPRGWKERWNRWTGRERQPLETTVRLSVASPAVSLPASSAVSLGGSLGGRIPAGWWFDQSLPLAAATLLFSVLYFYAFPRLNHGFYSHRGMGEASIGFNDSMTLDQVGALLQNDAVVLRIEFETLQGEPYEPTEPPYLRGVSLSEYRPNGDRGYWFQGDLSEYLMDQRGKQLPPESLVRDSLRELADPVVARIHDSGSTGAYSMVVAPFFRHDDSVDSEMLRKVWQLSDRQIAGFNQKVRRTYSFRTTAFQRGMQTRWMADSDEYFIDEDRQSHGKPEDPRLFTRHQWNQLTRFHPSRMRGVLECRDRILTLEEMVDSSRVEQAFAIERYLSSGREFQYTTDLNLPRDPLLDPIEDFVVHQKRGHCQFFASAMTMMMRSLEVPTRVVVGFRPNEYNDVGNYFLVRQNHAHAWLECFFTRNQLEVSGRYQELPEELTGAWVRFDPTPAGSGSNAGVSIREPQRATFDFVEHLWKRYVIDMDRSHQTPLMEELSRSSKGMYRQYYQRLHEWLESSLPKLSGGSNAVWIDRAIVGALFLVVPFAIGLVLLGWIVTRMLWRKWTGPPARRLLSDQRVRWASGVLPLMESLDREVCRKEDSETLAEWLDRVLDAGRSQSVSPASIDAVRSFLASYLSARYGVSIPAEAVAPPQLPTWLQQIGLGVEQFRASRDSGAPSVSHGT